MNHDVEEILKQLHLLRSQEFRVQMLQQNLVNPRATSGHQQSSSTEAANGGGGSSPYQEVHDLRQGNKSGRNDGGRDRGGTFLDNPSAFIQSHNSCSEDFQEEAIRLLQQGHDLMLQHTYANYSPERAEASSRSFHQQSFGSPHPVGYKPGIYAVSSYIRLLFCTTIAQF